MSGLLSPLPADREREFQVYMAMDPAVRAWRRAFVGRHGEQPDTEVPNYNYRAAWKYGAKPEPSESDSGAPHWPSQVEAPPYRNPIYLKSPDHPTMWKQQFMDQFGINPDQVRQWTPEMQAFVQRVVLPRGLLD